MQFLRISLLIAAVNCFGDQSGKFRFEEAHQRISSIFEPLKKEYLETSVLNGNITSLDWAKQILNREIKEDILQEYSKIDISEGLKEQNELLGLIEKVRETEITDEIRKGIREGIKAIEDLETYDLKQKTTEAKENAIFDINEYFVGAGTLYNDPRRFELTYGRLALIKNFVSSVRAIVPDLDAPLTQQQIDALRPIYGRVNEENYHMFIASSWGCRNIIRNVANVSFYTTFRNLKPVDLWAGGINEAEDKFQQKDAEGLKSNLESSIEYMKALVQLRETKQPAYVEKLKIQLQNTIQEISQKPMALSRTHSEEINKLNSITNLIDSMNLKMKEIEVKSISILRTLPFVSAYLKKLNTFRSGLPSGELYISFENFKSRFEAECNFDISAEKSRWDEIKTSLNKVQKSMTDLANALHSLNVYGDDTIYKVCTDVFEFGQFKSDMAASLRKTVGLIDHPLILKHCDQLESRKGREADPERAMSYYESETLIIQNTLKSLDQKSTSDFIVSFHDKLQQNILCYSKIRDYLPEMKMMDLSNGEGVSEDWKVLENTVETIKLFGGAYKFYEAVRNWKTDSRNARKSYALDKGSFNEVNNGVDSLKTIKNILGNWETLENFDNFDWQNIENPFEKVIYSVGNFLENLDHSDTNQDTQKLLTTLSFSSALPFDSIMSFIESKYTGGRKKEILKFLIDIRSFENNYPKYSDDMKKLYELVEEFESSGDDYVATLDQETDCTMSPTYSAETICQINFSTAPSDAPIKKFVDK